MKRVIFSLLLIFSVSIVVYLYWDLGSLVKSPINIVNKQDIIDQISYQNELDEIEKKSEFLFPWQERNIVSIEEPTLTSMISYQYVITTPQWEEK
jgi:hypothetical protein